MDWLIIRGIYILIAGFACLSIGLVIASLSIIYTMFKEYTMQINTVIVVIVMLIYVYVGTLSFFSFALPIVGKFSDLTGYDGILIFVIGTILLCVFPVILLRIYILKILVDYLDFTRMGSFNVFIRLIGVLVAMIIIYSGYSKLFVYIVSNYSLNKIAIFGLLSPFVVAFGHLVLLFKGIYLPAVMIYGGILLGAYSVTRGRLIL